MVLAVAAPEVASLLLLHRHLDGVITFVVKDDEGWRRVRAVRASDLDREYPSFRDKLLRDSYVSLNAAYRMAKGSRGPVGWSDHNTGTLRYLCACYCDIDFYNVGLTYDQAMTAVHDRVADGTLPSFSLVVRSGRGLWVLWLLHDEKETANAHLGAYQDNWRNHLQLHGRINQAIVRRLSSIGADPAATDAARYIRLPGSFRNDTEEYVEWHWVGENAVPTYTLAELGNRFGVNQRTPGTIGDRIRAAGECPARRAGYDAANNNRLKVLHKLQELRGGITEGHRNVAAFMLTANLYWVGNSRQGANRELEAFAAEFRPALTKANCRSTVSCVYKNPAKHRKGLMSYRAIADKLDVTPREAEAITEMLRKPFPASSRFEDDTTVTRLAPAGKRDTEALLRRMEIRRLVEGFDAVPSCRKLQHMLLAAGIKAGHVTVMADLKAMQLVGAFCPPV
jgi:hypothetical protein